jgi:hypothetical protein
MKVGLEHDDAPVLDSPHRRFRLAVRFRSVRIVPERRSSPVCTAAEGHAATAFVGTFNALPRPLVSRFGWHLLGFCEK